MQSTSKAEPRTVAWWRELADAVAEFRDALDEWLYVRGRRGRENYERRHCMNQRRALLEAYRAFGQRIGRPMPRAASPAAADAVERLRRWQTEHTPLPDLFGVDDLQLIATGARVLDREAGTLEAELPDELLVAGTARTPGERAVWDALEGREQNAVELAKRLGTRDDAIRHHVGGLRAKGYPIATVGRGRASRYTRPDAPPPAPPR